MTRGEGEEGKGGRVGRGEEARRTNGIEITNAAIYTTRIVQDRFAVKRDRVRTAVHGAPRAINIK